MSEEEERLRESDRARQDTIDLVFEQCQGLPMEEIEARLAHEMTERGLVCPPDPWLESVAAEIHAGRVYVANPDAARHDEKARRHEPPDQS